MKESDRLQLMKHLSESVNYIIFKGNAGIVECVTENDIQTGRHLMTNNSLQHCETVHPLPRIFINKRFIKMHTLYMNLLTFNTKTTNFKMLTNYHIFISQLRYMIFI